MKPVDLTTCDQEPIHTPGAIQPHGALLVLDADLVVRHASVNVTDFLGSAAGELIGKSLAADLIGADALERVREAYDTRNIELLNPIAVHDGTLEAIVHRSGDYLLLEFERPAADARPPHMFAVASQQAISRLHACESLSSLLSAAVDEVKRLSGFDRVMCYRFAPDGHGEVVSEAREEHLESYLGLHYPASDIPAQARRLYSLNRIRLIVDVSYAPVPIEPALRADTGEPLDLSFSVLRSVSPIHCEYLSNMGIHGSMSISLMVEGQLWGLIACHHYAPYHAPFTTRITSQLLAETLSMMTEQFVRRETDARLKTGYARIGELVQTCQDEEDVLKGLARHEESVLRMFGADGALVCTDSRIVALGTTPPADLRADIVRWFAECDDDGGIWSTRSLSDSFAGAQGLEHIACGLLGGVFHRSRGGFLLLLRREHREEVNWAGDPNKQVEVGPLGARLTPRGSFELWKEEVSGKSREWDQVETELLEHMCGRLTELSLTWASARDRMRDMLVGMVGHDMRTPLSAIAMAAEYLDEEEGARPIARRISSSSRRMQTLVDQLMDLNQIQTGKGLGITFAPTDIHALVARIVQEAELAYPGSNLRSELAGTSLIECDADRCEQAVSNLVSNARHHGARAQPITVRVEDDADADGFVVISVHNWGEPIAEEVRRDLFKAYQGTAKRSERASGGLGLGLFITQTIAKEHGGSVEVDSSKERGTTFRLRLPKHRDADA